MAAKRTRTPSASKRGPGKPSKPVLTKELVEQALRDCRGLVTYAARKLGVDNAAINYWMRKHPELAQLRDEHEVAMLDTVENNLWAALERGDSWATCFVAKTKGRKRGYSEKVDLSVEGKLDQRVIIQVVTGVPRDTPEIEELFKDL